MKGYQALELAVVALNPIVQKLRLPMLKLG
jgi:hypothetical protein